MRLLIRFLRIYTPFICTLMALLNGVYFISDYPMDNFAFLASALTGNSILLDIYMFITSLRMCIWYKLNLLCLLLVQMCGILYSYFDIDTSLYLWVVVLLSALGIICFLVFRVLYNVTTAFGCSYRHSRKSKQR